MRTKPTLEFSDAAAILAACEAQAQAASVKVAIAVVDEAGVLLALHRLDGAKAHTVDLAVRKARTAALLGLRTSLLEEMAKQGRLTGTDVLALGGGAPAMAAGQPAGGVGVSGSTSEVDEQIAAAGCARLAG